MPSVLAKPLGALVSSNVYVPAKPTGIPFSFLKSSSPPILYLSSMKNPTRPLFIFLVSNTHVLNGVNPEVSLVFSL